MTNERPEPAQIVIRNGPAQLAISVGFGIMALLGFFGLAAQPLGQDFPLLAITLIAAIFTLRAIRAGTVILRPTELILISQYRTRHISRSDLVCFDAEIGVVGLLPQTYLVIKRTSDITIKFNSCAWLAPSKRRQRDKGKEAASTLNDALRTWRQKYDGPGSETSPRA